MGAPWAFVGTWLPNVEGAVDTGTTPTGSGTVYPLLWDRIDGAVSDDQICRFEWTAKTLTFASAGTASLTFNNPDPFGTPPTAIGTGSYSMSASDTPTPGTDWSVLEPSDLLPSGGREWTAGTSAVVPVTLPWGDSSIIFTLTGTIGGVLGEQPTAVILGSGEAQYVKSIHLKISAENGVENITYNSIQAGGTSLIFDASVLHGTVGMYGDAASSGDFTASYDVIVAEVFAAPADI